VDSDQYDTFDEVDQQFLEQIMSRLSRFDPAPVILASPAH
jgi:putative methionine-R-sulfoxide reductase with GAF domain